MVCTNPWKPRKEFGLNVKIKLLQPLPSKITSVFMTNYPGWPEQQRQKKTSSRKSITWVWWLFQQTESWREQTSLMWFSKQLMPSIVRLWVPSRNSMKKDNPCWWVPSPLKSRKQSANCSAKPRFRTRFWMPKITSVKQKSLPRQAKSSLSPLQRIWRDVGQTLSHPQKRSSKVGSSFWGLGVTIAEGLTTNYEDDPDVKEMRVPHNSCFPLKTICSGYLEANESPKWWIGFKLMRMSRLSMSSLPRPLAMPRKKWKDIILISENMYFSLTMWWKSKGPSFTRVEGKS